MPKKSFAEYRIEAKALNQAEESKGNPPPIPNYGSMRKEPLAKTVIQVRLDQHRGEGR
jgi:hypothetical protein